MSSVYIRGLNNPWSFVTLEDHQIPKGSPLETFICCVCDSLLMTINTLSCGDHSMCLKCYKQLEEYWKSSLPKCPVDYKLLDTTSCATVHLDVQKFKTATLFCRYKNIGCCYEGECQSVILNHQSSCVFQSVECKNCLQKVQLRFIVFHRLECITRAFFCNPLMPSHSSMPKVHNEDSGVKSFEKYHDELQDLVACLTSEIEGHFSNLSKQLAASEKSQNEINLTRQHHAQLLEQITQIGSQVEAFTRQQAAESKRHTSTSIAILDTTKAYRNVLASDIKNVYEAVNNLKSTITTATSPTPDGATSSSFTHHQLPKMPSTKTEDLTIAVPGKSNQSVGKADYEVCYDSKNNTYKVKLKKVTNRCELLSQRIDVWGSWPLIDLNFKCGTVTIAPRILNSPKGHHLSMGCSGLKCGNSLIVDVMASDQQHISCTIENLMDICASKTVCKAEELGKVVVNDTITLKFKLLDKKEGPASWSTRDPDRAPAPNGNWRKRN